MEWTAGRMVCPFSLQVYEVTDDAHNVSALLDGV